MCRRRRPVIVEHVVANRITVQQVLAVCIEQGVDEEFHEFVIEDVLRIVNEGYRYPPRVRRDNRLYFPEDFSIPLARRFGVEGRRMQ